MRGLLLSALSFDFVAPSAVARPPLPKAPASRGTSFYSQSRLARRASPARHADATGNSIDVLKFIKTPPSKRSPSREHIIAPRSKACSSDPHKERGGATAGRGGKQFAFGAPTEVEEGTRFRGSVRRKRSPLFVAPFRSNVCAPRPPPRRSRRCASERAPRRSE